MNVDDFVQFFVRRGLNEKFQRKLIQVTTKTHLSIQEIEENFFAANERYLNLVKSRQKKPLTKLNLKSSAMAVKVDLNSNKRTCLICHSLKLKDANHSIKWCPNFPSNSLKISKLKLLGGCLKCGNIVHLNHTTNKCLFHLKENCKNCGDDHIEFLCPQSSQNTSEVDQPKSSNLAQSSAKQKFKTNKVKNQPEKVLSSEVTKETNNRIALTISAFTSLSCETILPTFSFRLDSELDLLRGLKDMGSQSSFVSERIASKHKFNVIQSNLNLSINGFNNSQNYQTKLVEVSIVLDNKTYSVEAMIIYEAIMLV